MSKSSKTLSVGQIADRLARRGRGWNRIGGKSLSAPDAIAALTSLRGSRLERLGVVFADRRLTKSESASLTADEKRARRNNQQRTQRARTRDRNAIKREARVNAAPLDSITWIDSTSLETFADFGRTYNGANLEVDGVKYRFYLAFDCIVDPYSSYAANLDTENDDGNYRTILTPYAGDFTVRDFARLEMPMVGQKKRELERTAESAEYIGAFTADNFENGQYTINTRKRRTRKKLNTKQKREKRQAYYIQNPEKRKANRGKK